MESNKTYKTVDDYISGVPKEIQKNLLEIRRTIKSVAPDAQESISYMMPGYKVKNAKGKYIPLAYFGAFKNHIGFFPTPSPLLTFEKELSKFKTSKGGVQFPYDEPMPLALIKRIVEYRLKQSKIRI